MRRIGALSIQHQLSSAATIQTPMNRMSFEPSSFHQPNLWLTADRRDAKETALLPGRSLAYMAVPQFKHSTGAQIPIKVCGANGLATSPLIGNRANAARARSPSGPFAYRAGALQSLNRALNEASVLANSCARSPSRTACATALHYASPKVWSGLRGIHRAAIEVARAQRCHTGSLLMPNPTSSRWKRDALVGREWLLSWRTAPYSRSSLSSSPGRSTRLVSLAWTRGWSDRKEQSHNGLGLWVQSPRVGKLCSRLSCSKACSLGWEKFS